MQAGGDVRMGLRIHVGIDAHRKRRRLAQMRRARRQQLQLAGTLHVETAESRPAARDRFRPPACRPRRTPPSAPPSVPPPVRAATRRRKPRRTRRPASASSFSTDKVRIRLHRIADGVLLPGKRAVELFDSAGEWSRRNRRTVVCHTSSPSARATPLPRTAHGREQS